MRPPGRRYGSVRGLGVGEALTRSRPTPGLGPGESPVSGPTLRRSTARRAPLAVTLTLASPSPRTSLSSRPSTPRTSLTRSFPSVRTSRSPRPRLSLQPPAPPAHPRHSPHSRSPISLTGSPSRRLLRPRSPHHRHRRRRRRERHRFQGRFQVVQAGAEGRVLLQEGGEDGPQGACRGREFGLLVQDRVQGCQGRVAGEGGAAGEGRAQGGAQGPDVGRWALGTAGDAFGGHVVGGADEHADHGEGLRVLDRRDTEVRQDHPAPPARPGHLRLHQDVARLDVPVEYAPGVDLAQCRQQPDADPGRLARAQRPLLRHDAFQGSAGHQLHDDPQAFALVDHVVDPDDVGVVDACRRPRLPQGAFTACARVLGVEAVDAHFLDGDEPIEHFVNRSPHAPHSPLADTLDQSIAPRHQ